MGNPLTLKSAFNHCLRLPLALIIVLCLVLPGVSVTLQDNWLQVSFQPSRAFAAPTTITATVNASADDIYVYLQTDNITWIGSIVATSGGVGTYSAAVHRQGVGFIFRNINIPIGESISAASFNVTSKALRNLSTVNSTICAENNTLGLPFTTIANFKARRGAVVGGATSNLTSASVLWSAIPAWSADVTYTSPDISTIIQELVNSPYYKGDGTDNFTIFFDDFADSSTYNSQRERAFYLQDYGTEAYAPSLTITYGSNVPVVSSVTPTYGTDAGGTSVNISGANFQAGATVDVNGVPATGVNVVSSALITAVTPAGTPGAQNVSVNQSGESGNLTGGYWYVHALPNVATITRDNVATLFTFRIPWQDKGGVDRNNLFLTGAFGSNGNIYIMHSSNNGSTWSAPALFLSGIADYEYAIDIDEVNHKLTVIHDHHGDVADNDLYYQRYTINADASLTPDAADQSIYTPTEGWGLADSDVAVSSGGYPMIVCAEVSASANTSLAVAFTSSTNNGTFTMTRTVLHDAYTNQPTFKAVQPTLVALNSNRMGVAYGTTFATSGTVIYFRLWDGAAFGDQENATTSMLSAGWYDLFSIAAVGDDVYLAFTKWANGLISAKRVYGATPAWQAEQTISATFSSPMIKSNGNQVAVFFADTNNIYTASYNGTAWNTPVSSANETLNGGIYPNAYNVCASTNGTSTEFKAWYTSGNSTAHFFRVLSYTASGSGVSAPTVVTNAASSITSSSAVLSGNLTSKGGQNSTAIFYWDTSDKGSTLNDWSNNGTATAPAQPMDVGEFTLTISSLSPNTQYFFRASANNTAGIGQGSTANFTTSVAITSPGVTNDGGATNITNTTARLNGEITDTGNENPTVVVFYGTSDGGAVAASWSNNATIGVEALGTFYYDVGILTQNTLYYYRMRAVNSANTTWAASSANFTTTNIAALDPPTNLTLTDTGGVGFTVTWDIGAGAIYTMVRLSRVDYPATTSAYEQIYYGTGTTVTVTGAALDTSQYFVNAWSFAADNTTASSNTSATIGGTGMTSIASTFTLLLSLLVVAFINILAFKYGDEPDNLFLWFLPVAANGTFGSYLATTGTPGSALWVEGICIIVLSGFILCRIAIRMFFRKIK